MGLYQLTEIEIDAVTGGSRRHHGGHSGGDRQTNVAVVVGVNYIDDGSANVRGKNNSGGQYIGQEVNQSND